MYDENQNIYLRDELKLGLEAHVLIIIGMDKEDELSEKTMNNNSQEGEYMGLYRLNYTNKDLSDGFMEKANRESIDYEKDFENWLENSPHVLFEEEASTIIWIGRQVSATGFENIKYPDLLGVDGNGNVVVVELKKGKTPRDVVAQILEYATWADKLTYDELNNLTMKYYDRDEKYSGLELLEIHKTIFDPDDENSSDIVFNNRIRLYIVAEEVSKSVKNVVKYLNNRGGIDINCMKYDVFKAGNEEFYISTEIDEADFGLIKQKHLYSDTAGWNGNTPVKEVVKEAVGEILRAKDDGVFTGKEVIQQVLKKYPNCNKSTIRCQIYADCVNHNSRKHYKGGQLDQYFTVSKGKFRLYNRKNDGVWNAEGELIE